jgi:hypothetical protein
MLRLFQAIHCERDGFNSGAAVSQEDTVEIDAPSKVNEIRRLNDRLRTEFLGGHILLTSGVSALDVEIRKPLMKAIQTFDAFTEDNDPHGEHDFLSVEVNGEKYFAKIDYYAPDMEHGSDDPADPKKTRRVLTIMHSSEY